MAPEADGVVVSGPGGGGEERRAGGEWQTWADDSDVTVATGNSRHYQPASPDSASSPQKEFQSSIQRFVLFSSPPVSPIPAPPPPYHSPFPVPIRTLAVFSSSLLSAGRVAGRRYSDTRMDWGRFHRKKKRAKGVAEDGRKRKRKQMPRQPRRLIWATGRPSGPSPRVTPRRIHLRFIRRAGEPTPDVFALSTIFHVYENVFVRPAIPPSNVCTLKLQRVDPETLRAFENPIIDYKINFVACVSRMYVYTAHKL